MNILGISSFYHDSSACLVRDGVIVAAAQEERFSRVKNTGVFPIQAINYCIQAGELTLEEIDAVGYFEKPYLKFSRVILDHLASYPFSFGGFVRSMPKWLDQRLTLPIVIEDELRFKDRPYFIKHHLSHAASAFLPSPFEEAAILTVDGVGEWATLSCGVGRGNGIEITREIHYPDSLGLLYTAVTTFLGFEAHEGEGKTMGLAGYGKPRLLDKLRKIINVLEDGSFRVDQRYFGFRAGRRMWSAAFEELFGPPRRAGTPFEERHYDLAASVQALLEDTMIKIARSLHQETGSENLCLAGGVTLNCVANAKILDQTPFKRIFIQPAAGDAGGALGVALYIDHCLHKKPRVQSMEHAFLGPSFSDLEILEALKSAGVTYRKLDEDQLVAEVARKIQGNQIIGWFNGKMEFGPRSLGNRSILANPGHPGMKEILNSKIKKRESFRPFAPMVLREKSHEYFEMDHESPYMLLAPQVRPEKRSHVPAITHVDGTARVQTVDENSNPRIRKLLLEFEKLSGVPMIINTSFNRSGEPVVCRPEDAIDCFLGTQMDCLAIGDYLVERLGLVG
jgi:carbamoyltransferase